MYYEMVILVTQTVNFCRITNQMTGGKTVTDSDNLVVLNKSPDLFPDKTKGRTYSEFEKSLDNIAVNTGTSVRLELAAGTEFNSQV